MHVANRAHTWVVHVDMAAAVTPGNVMKMAAMVAMVAAPIITLAVPVSDWNYMEEGQICQFCMCFDCKQLMHASYQSGNKARGFGVAVHEWCSSDLSLNCLMSVYFAN